LPFQDARGSKEFFLNCVIACGFRRFFCPGSEIFLRSRQNLDVHKPLVFFPGAYNRSFLLVQISRFQIVQKTIPTPAVRCGSPFRRSSTPLSLWFYEVVGFSREAFRYAVLRFTSDGRGFLIWSFQNELPTNSVVLRSLLSFQDRLPFFFPDMALPHRMLL